MNYKGTNGLIKVLSVFLAAFLLFNLLPNRNAFRVDAALVNTFHVKLPTDIKGSIYVLLKNEADDTDTRTVSAVNGDASFPDFVDDLKTYTLFVTGMIGYQDYTLTSQQFDGSDCVIAKNDLTAITKTTVSGSLVDENNQPYTGSGNIIYSGYETGKVSFSNGFFSLAIYKSKDYKMTIQTDDPKYNTKELGTINTSTGLVLPVSKLEINKYTIATNSPEHGSFTPSNPSVLYGANQTVSADAAVGYKISEFKVDGSVVTQAKDQDSYSHTFFYVTAPHTIDVVYAQKSYAITTANYSPSDGSVTPSIPSVLHGGEQLISADAKDGYRISEFRVDGSLITAAHDLKNYGYTFSNVTENHNISVSFYQKSYKVTVKASSNGKVNSHSSEQVKYPDADSSFKISMEPAAGYYFDKLLINGITIASKDITVTPDEIYYTISKVTEDCDINVTFAKCTVLPDPATDYYTMTYLPVGALISTVTSPGSATTYVFKNHSTVSFEEKTPYSMIYTNNETWPSTSALTYGESKTITAMYVGTDPNLMNIVPIYPTNPIQIIIDNDPPQLTASKDFDWSSDSTTISGIASDPSTSDKPSSGLVKVVWADCNLDAPNIIAEKTNCTTIAADGSYSFKITGEQKKKYYVYTVDVAGNVSAAATVDVYIDATPPTIDKFEIKEMPATPEEKAINYLSFGTFFNQQILVAVRASDPQITSGLKSITLYINDVPFQTIDSLTDSIAVFTIPSALLDNQLFDVKLTATATDNVGNTTKPPIALSAANSNVISDSVMLETIKPVIDIVPDAAEHTDSEGKLWYSDNTGVTVHASDLNSGIQSVSIRINNQPITADADGNPLKTDYSQEKSNDVSIKVSTAEGARDSVDGSYLIDVTVVDNAGNTETSSKTVYKDIDDPSITEFAFSPVGTQEADGKIMSTEIKDYGYYFTEDTTVTVSARDSVPTSGIASITFCTIDVNGTKTEKTVNTAGDKISFVIPANFKGQIYAKAKDFVGNEPDSYVTPNSVIIENSSMHQQEQHIAFTKDAAAQKDVNNLDLYSKDTNVQVTVSDTYSGLRKVEWTVIAPNDSAKNQSGVIEIGNDKQVTGDSAGWTQDLTDKNLVTKMTRTLTVTNNSNAIKVWVRITDRSGNVSENILTFSIDKTAPTIGMSFDNNSADSTYKDLYKADRTATVVITERNFNPEDVITQIANTEQSVPVISSWTTQTNAADPDKTTHTATVLFAADGDYTFDLNYSDNAKNAAADYPSQAFTIDKTLPKVSVSYNNQESQNGNYYKADRTATVTVVEHNFDASRIKIEGTAADDGKNVTFPSIGTWTSQGDTHTAQIQYTSDARYTFDISGIDKAGNSLADYTQEQFYIDKTAPEISITGVTDKSANNGDVIPVISYSDTNFDKSTVAITLTGSNRGVVKTNGTTAAQSNGGVFTFSNFEKTKENDDLYTLKVTLVDLAGNQTTKSIAFSVNRFGSVYSFAETLKAIEGKYVHDPIDVAITETNVDSLKQDSIQLKMTYNGTPQDLVNGTDYTIQETGGNGIWSQYTYTINQSLFSGDGRYTITLYSEDLAGNVNENIDESKKAEISFGIDKTAPDIVSVDLDSNQQYPVTSKTATFAIKDNLILKSVSIYLDGKEVTPTIDGENYTISIGSQNQKQVVKIVSVDAAGNQSTLEIDNFLVTTNLFYRWINNTMLFVLSLVGMGILIVAIVVYFVFFRRRRHVRREMHR